MKILLIFIINITIFFTVNLFACAQALTPDKVFDMVKDSIIVVKTLNSEGKVKSQGSGVILPSRKIATNCHVLEGGFSYQVGRLGQFASASLYAQDSDKDICILDAKGVTGKPVHLGNTSSLKVGVPVYAVGAPYGLELSLSNGIVSQLRGGHPPLIQMTASISPGSSGGGLFDEKGSLIGITTLYMEGGQNLNFAMPVEWINEVKPGIKKAKSGIGQVEWSKRAAALMELEDWHGLLDWCQKWTKSEPQNATAWVILGVACRETMRHNDAVVAFNQAIRLQPGLATAYLQRGSTYRNLGQYQKAIADYNEGIRLEPNSGYLHGLRGIAYAAIGQHQLAITDFNMAVKLQPDNASNYAIRGNGYLALGQYEQACQDWKKACLLGEREACEILTVAKKDGLCR